jgi:hypothetical protein
MGNEREVGSWKLEPFRISLPEELSKPFFEGGKLFSILKNFPDEILK